MAPDTFSNTVVMNSKTYDILKRMLQSEVDKIPEGEFWREEELNEYKNAANNLGITLEL